MNHGWYELVIKRTKRYDFSYELRGICGKRGRNFRIVDLLKRSKMKRHIVNSAGAVAVRWASRRARLFTNAAMTTTVREARNQGSGGDDV